MKIRHLVLTSSFAGVERHVCVLANQQVRDGQEVEVWGGAPSSMREMLDPRVRFRPGRSLLALSARGLLSARPDVVHAHMTRAELAAAVGHWAKGVPVVATRHFAAPRGATATGRVVRRLIARRVRAEIAISRYVAARIGEESTVVYPGVEEDSSLSGPRRPVVLVVQRLQPEKATAVALRVFAAGAPSDWTLKIVGKGPELGELVALAGELGIADRTEFLGFRSDVGQLMREASVLIAPCPVEGLGLSVLEAMARGLPVLASEAGAHPETVGLAPAAHLFAAGDVHDGAAQLASLCAADDLRDSYGRQLLEVQSQHFTPVAQARATDLVYRRVMS